MKFKAGNMFEADEQIYINNHHKNYIKTVKILNLTVDNKYVIDNIPFNPNDRWDHTLSVVSENTLLEYFDIFQFNKVEQP